MHGIHNYIPATNHVCIVYSVAAVLYLQGLPHVILYHPCNMFCTFTSALHAVCVQCPIWLVFVVPWFHAFSVRCSVIVWVILRGFQSPMFLPISLLLSHSTCDDFLLWSIQILKFFSFFLDHISVCRNCNIYWHPCSLFIITHYDVPFICKKNSVVLHFSFHNMVTLPYQFLYMAIQLFVV